MPTGEALLERVAERLEEFAVRRFLLGAAKAVVFAAVTIAAAFTKLAARIASAHFDPFAIGRIRDENARRG